MILKEIREEFLFQWWNVIHYYHHFDDPLCGIQIVLKQFPQDFFASLYSLILHLSKYTFCKGVKMIWIIYLEPYRPEPVQSVQDNLPLLRTTWTDLFETLYFYFSNSSVQNGLTD